MDLLERDNLLVEIQGRLKKAATGSCCLILLAGEAGAEKTALIQRFQQDVQDKARLAIGRERPIFRVIETVRSSAPGR